MSVEFEMRKWCAIVKLEGYTTPASARALVQKFHNIVESFRDEGVDLDVFMLVEDENELRSVDESVTRKPDRTKER
ncbi:hypothetical protein E6H28_06805 [Candidatus Bathyarchaeota archaeon]|nr:MAG: hypothetical protein E6H28_06805 [Candidatus Bathyarchaeota archaeon]